MINGPVLMDEKRSQIERERRSAITKGDVQTPAHDSARGNVLSGPDSCAQCHQWHDPSVHAERKQSAQEAFARIDEADRQREAENERRAGRFNPVSPDKPRDLTEKGHQRGRIVAEFALDVAP